ncbi:hypothetical protein F183_A41960 [Bryobacterales bacterium F-183]|nr:hypothetical protein F183_A41960 [Bryobacterales bacterium F-183]
MACYLHPERQVYRSELLDTMPWLRHGFGTALAVDWPGDTATLKQTHSDHVHVVATSCCGEQGEGDALVTNVAGTAVSIRTADCVPVLLADPVHHVVAAVHAGWKGTSKAIVQRAVERMTADFGTRPGHLVAAVGPAIGECCYEVSADVGVQFTRYGVEIPKEGKPHLNLAQINRMQLVEAGVAQVDVLDVCTKCEATLCHSFRRDGERSGRMHAVIGIYTEGRN